MAISCRASSLLRLLTISFRDCIDAPFESVHQIENVFTLFFRWRCYVTTMHLGLDEFLNLLPIGVFILGEVEGILRPFLDQRLRKPDLAPDLLWFLNQTG